MKAEEIEQILIHANTFLSLNEIYTSYRKTHDISAYKDYKAAIRTCLYRNCWDRFLNQNNTFIFYALERKKAKGQKYGLLKWKNDSKIDYLKSDSLLDNTDEINIDSIFADSVIYPKEHIVSCFKRSTIMKSKAIERAHFFCEIDPTHYTFIRRSNGEKYTEAHHIIPLSAQSLEKYKNINLDCLSNIISLCSNCHNELHYGEHIEVLLKQIYEARKDLLKRDGIEISFDELIQFYR